MITLVCKKPGVFEYETRDVPECTKDNAVIKIRRIGVCGTDLHAFEGTQPFFNYPRILGHELAGELIDYDGDENFKRGDIVTFIPYFACGKCIACRSGKPNCCMHIQVFGVHIDGGMAEYIQVPSASLLHCSGLSLDEIGLIEPLAIGAHGIKRADVKREETVLIIGAGPIGLAAMQFAKLAGAKIIAMDVNENRLSFCREKFNIKHTINAANDSVVACLNEITKGDMPEMVIDATGNLKAINQAFAYLAHGGRYVLIGLQKGDISFNHPEFHKREATLMSSRNATREDFENVIFALKRGWIDPEMFITHRVALDQVKNEFKSWLNPDNHVIKAMIEIN